MYQRGARRVSDHVSTIVASDRMRVTTDSDDVCLIRGVNTARRGEKRDARGALVALRGTEMKCIVADGQDIADSGQRLAIIMQGTVEDSPPGVKYLVIRQGFSAQSW